MQYYVYILTTVNNTALYIVVTNDLTRRTIEHQNEQDGFCGKYKVCKLVYYELTGDVKSAIAREHLARAKANAHLMRLTPFILSDSSTSGKPFAQNDKSRSSFRYFVPPYGGAT